MGATIPARIIHMHDIETNWNQIPEFIPKCGELIVYDPIQHIKLQDLRLVTE